nr:hypothetical protein [Tanacetum cinerariifolium]GEY43299.1 hypothetical protein [Tanacetum cinerariifolium]
MIYDGSSPSRLVFLPEAGCDTYPYKKRWKNDHPLHKIIGDPKSSVRTRAQIANSCLFACLLSSIELANVIEALKNAEWVSAMQEELDQFTRLKVWRLVPRPKCKTIMNTKWIFKNKKDESSLVIQNKTRLKAQGYRQEEGINYDETFSPVAQIEAIHLFLAYVASKDFTVSSAKGIHVYALDKALYSLKQAHRAWPDITFATCLWYLKDSGYDLMAYSDADHAGCHLDRKTEAEYVVVSGCCAQILWMRTQLTDYGFFYNKVPIYCNSNSVIVMSCNPVQHTQTKHIDVMYHFIKDHVEKGTIELYFVGTKYQLADLFTKSLHEA